MPQNKFYVGSKEISSAFGMGINHSWTRETVEEAVRHAKEKIETGESDCLVIVQIIRVVRRQKPPIIVQRVK